MAKEGMRSVKKWTAFFISTALAAAIFISYLCIAEKASHDCEGDQCPVCGEIEMCIETIAHYHSLLDGTGAAPVLSEAVPSYPVMILSFIVFFAPVSTLVSLRVKLSI